VVERTLLQRLHNPRNSTCGCDADCWCNALTIGRAVKWWFPARLFGVHHKYTSSPMFVGWSEKDIKEWKRNQDLEARKQRMSPIAGSNHNGLSRPRPI
jgi:hypothetical protein